MMNHNRIAVTYDNGQVFQHFGHTECFKVYDVENGAIKQTSLLSTNGSGHSALADLLKQEKVDTLICGGIGGGAKIALAEAGITLYGGVTGEADQAVNDLLADKLVFHPDATCNHAGEHHGEHHCGERHDGHHCAGHCSHN